jgi:pyruvate formate lyase activating enzyme
MKAADTGKEFTGTVLEIIRMSTEDGPGIRTTVFFKGCTLKCGWCHNPESISLKPQLQWIGVNCIACGICVEACPEGALSKDGGGIVIDRERCRVCGTCVEACPSTAMELLGKEWNADNLVKELVKDRAYFEQSGGGVTLSGGEAAMQSGFCLRVLRGLKAVGISTALDTCGQVPRKNLEALLPFVDLVLFDLKEIDTGRHREFVGAGNERVLENAIFVAEYVKEHLHPYRLWIRTPLIPGATASRENVVGIGEFIARNLNGAVERWELCAFNNLCRDKYLRLGLEWPFADAPLLSRGSMEEFAAAARESGVDPSIVRWSGSTLLEGRGAEALRTPAKAPGC